MPGKSTKLTWSHKINYDGSTKPLVFRISDLTEETSTNNNIKLNSKLLDKFANILSRSRIIIVDECKKLFLKLTREFVSKFGDTIKTISHIVATIDVAVSTAACLLNIVMLNLYFVQSCQTKTQNLVKIVVHLILKVFVTPLLNGYKLKQNILQIYSYLTILVRYYMVQ